MIHLVSLSKNYGTQTLFENASARIRPGDRVALVGPNGAGKTTVFRLIVGEETPSSGQVSISDRVVVGYFSQDVGEMRGRPVIDEVKAGAGRVAELARTISELEGRMAEPLEEDEMAAAIERYGEAQAEFQERGGYDLDARAAAILTGLGIPVEEQQRPVETFSGGWKMRIALARILVLNPDLLLMDEPTNHLDLESMLWLEEWLAGFRGALVVTSHDREFLNRNATRVIEIEGRQFSLYAGDYEFYLREREVRREQLRAAHRKQEALLAKEEEFIARFAARASHAAQVQSRVKKLEKIERIEIATDPKAMRFAMPASPRSGDDVARAETLGMTYPGVGGVGKTVFRGASVALRRTEKVALVGVNGAGKSTLLKILSGALEPTEGRAVVGAGVRIGYFSQHALEVLDSRKTVFEEVYSRLADSTVGYVRNLLGAFLFSGDSVEKKVNSLSGGEKSRLVLATILARPLNFLIMDEPTNHLDIVSREILQGALERFDGTAILVSHDRHFLKAIATRVWELDRGELRVYPGSYADYLDRHARALHEPPQPEREGIARSVSEEAFSMLERKKPLRTY